MIIVIYIIRMLERDSMSEIIVGVDQPMIGMRARIEHYMNVFNNSILELKRLLYVLFLLSTTYYNRPQSRELRVSRRVLLFYRKWVFNRPIFIEMLLPN
jgi:hypothetical protein